MSVFQTIDTEAKAYALGLAAGDPEDLICTHAAGRSILADIARELDFEQPVIMSSKGYPTAPLGAESRRDVEHHLGIKSGRATRLPDIDENLRPHFLRALYDRTGSAVVDTPYPVVDIQCSESVLDELQNWFPTVQKTWWSGAWRGTEALDIMGYMHKSATLCSPKSLEAFRSLCVYPDKQPLTMRWAKLDDRALPPSKENVSDSGYDLTLIDAVKQKGNVTFFTTGVAVEPPYGWYFDLLPRSSISKTGYMLANSTGVIDRSYRGAVIAALVKIDPDAPDLELPNKLVQIVPRQVVHFQQVEVECLSETKRGGGGFGSTGK